MCMSLRSRLASFSNVEHTRCSGRVCAQGALLCFVYVCVCSSPSAVYVMANSDCSSSKMCRENALASKSARSTIGALTMRCI